MIWYKQGVCGNLQPVARKGLGAIAKEAEARGEDLFVTSKRDGNHQLNSLHYEGLAFDLRKPRLLGAADIKHILGDDWDVVSDYSDGHIHCEYDP